MSALQETIADELRSGKFEVPLLPQVASEVLSSTLDDRANAQRLAELIDKDQNLASHILRVVNSAAFRGSSEIVSLKQAIARLGMERIREIALSISLKSTLFQPGPHDALIQQIWSMGLATALWSKEVARVAKKNVEVAYLCGLLHNVGEPIVVNRAVQLEPEVDGAAVASLSQCLGQVAGKVLVEEWQLPALVATCMVPENEVGEVDLLPVELDTRLVLKAGKVAAKQFLGDCLGTDELVAQSCFQELNFYPDDIQELLDRQEYIQQTFEGMS